MGIDRVVQKPFGFIIKQLSPEHTWIGISFMRLDKDANIQDLGGCRLTQGNIQVWRLRWDERSKLESLASM